MRLCKDCKYYNLKVEERPYVQSLWSTLRGKAPETYKVYSSDCDYRIIDPVNGNKVYPGGGCYWLRERTDRCGPEGIWWEAK